MNKIYKVVWSKARNCYVVASELAKRHTKAPKSGVIIRTAVAGILASVLSCGIFIPVYAMDILNGTLSQYRPSGTDASTADNWCEANGYKKISNSIHSTALNEALLNFYREKFNDNRLEVSVSSVAINKDGNIAFLGSFYSPNANKYTGMSTGGYLLRDVIVHYDEIKDFGITNGLFDNFNSSGYLVNYSAVNEGIGAVASGDDSVAIGTDSKATGYNTIAIGPNATATGNSAMAMGSGSSASNIASTSYGWNSVSEGKGSVTLGGESNAKGDFDVAIGFDSEITSTKGNNVAVGVGSTIQGTDTEKSITVGSHSVVTKKESVAMGANSSVVGEGGVALGTNATVEANNSLALGSNSFVHYGETDVVSFGNSGELVPIPDENSYEFDETNGLSVDKYDYGTVIASANNPEYKRRLIHVADGINDSDAATVGQLTHFVGVNRSSTEYQFFEEDSSIPNYDGSGASGVSSIAIGPRAVANSHSTTAVGVESSAKGLGSTSLGWHATSEGQASIALGGMSKAKGDYDVALGFYSEVNSTGGNNIAIGTGADISGTGVSSSIAVGNQNRVTKSDAVAIGNNASSSAEGGIALGKGTSVSSNNSVAIGSDSVANQDNVVSFGHAAISTDVIEGQSFYELTDNFDSLEVLHLQGADVAVDGEIPELKRRLIYVADGVNDSDVATVGQLNNAVANVQNSVSSVQSRMSYVGTRFIGGNNRDGSGAHGSNTIAIGSNAYAEGNNDIVVGRNSSADDIDDAILIGRNNKAVSDGITYEYANNATPVVDNGDGTATSSTSVIIGDITPPSYFGAVLVGNDNTALATNGTGRYNSDYDSAIAHVVGVGDNVKLGDKYTVGLGYNAKATSISAVGIGRNADAKGESSIAFGTDTNANGHLSTAVGWDASSAGFSSIAIGSSSGASGSDAIAIGTNSNASGYHNVAIGNNSAVSKSLLGSDAPSSSVAIGDSSHVALSNSVAIGSNVVNNGLASVAIGSSSYASGDNSIAIGSNSVANQDDVVSFGKGSYDLRPTVSDDGLNLMTTEDGVAYNNVSTGGCDYPPGDGGEVPPEYKRRLIHVADGINDSDVATVGQVTAMLQNSAASNSINYYGVNSTGGSNVNGEEAIGTNAIAIGKDAAGVDKNTTAVGSHAWAIASGSVALGADSIATSSDEVSVGHQGGSYEYLNGNVGHGSSYSFSDGGDGSLYRRITNMKDGVGDHDAVTLGQMNRAVANFATSDSLDTKANIDLDNISDDGVNVVSTIAQRSTKVITGQNTNVTVGDDNGTVTYAVNVATNGAITEGNEGIVTGGAIYDALQNVSAGTGEITPYTAGDGIAISDAKQISVVKDGEIEHGNTGLVTGGQVYDKLNAYNENLTGILDGVVSSIEDDLDTKVKKNLSNLDNSGKNVVRSLAQNSIQLNAGQNTNLTVTASDGKLNYTIDTVANGEVANNNTGLMSGGAVYNEVRPANGNYIANNKTVAENLTVLDTSIKNVSDRVDALGGTIADTTVVRYDSDTKDKLTLNGTQGTTLTNLKNGAVTASSTDAVTGSQLYSVKRSVDDHTTAINTLQGNVTENANAITTLDGRVTSMEEIVTSAFNTAEEIQTTVGGLETAVGNVQTTVDEMQDTVSGLATDVDGVKSTVASLQGDVATMQDDVSGLQNDMTSVKSDVSDVKDTLGTVQADTAQIKENVTALQSDVGTLQQDVEAKANADGSNIDVAKFIEKMKAGENGVVTSEDLYVATRAQEDGAFVRKDASLSDNLLALDDGINRLNENVGKSHGLSVNFKNTNDANYNGAGATGDNAMAIGPSAEASGEDSIAIGNGSKASGLQSIAFGTGNQVSGNHSGAFGDPNDVSGDGSYAFGNDNTVSGNNTFVLGNNVSNASGNNTVVLGNGSDGSMDNVISVGAEGAERKIVHVAKGDISQNSTDAVTGGQLFDVQEDFRNAHGINADKWTQALGTGTVEDGNDNLVTGGTVFDAIKDLQIAQDVVAPNYATGHIDIGGNQKYDMIDTINVAKSDGSGRVITGIITDPGDVTSAANVGYVNAIGQNIADGVNEGFRKIDDKFSKAGASAAAMASLTPPPMDGDEKWAFSAAVGHYDGETAGAVGAFYRPQDNVIVNVRGAVGNGEDMVGAGVGVALQRGNTPSVSKAQLVRTVNAQAEKLQAQDNRMAEQSQVINEQNEKIASMQEQMMQMQETLRRLSEKSGM